MHQKSICVVTRNMAAGGAERVIAQLLTAWCKHGVDCRLILLDKKPLFYDIPHNVQLHEIGVLSSSAPVDKLKKYQQVRKIVKQTSPDVVLSLPEEIGIFVIGALLGTGVPVYVSERNDPRTMPYKKITRMLRKCLYPFAAGYIFQTGQAASFFSKRIQKKGIVLPNPLDLSRVPEPHSGQRRKVVVGAGRMDKQKNFPLLIDAFARFYKTHPEYTLVLYGDGDLREALTEYAHSRLPESAVSLPGRESDLLNKMRDAALFVLSSDYEGMPNVLIEAMACGVPCVSTRCPSGGPEELIENGVNGVLVPVGDVAAMAKAMTALIDHPDEAEHMAQKATAIRRGLDAEIVCRQWLTYLTKTEN